MYYRPLGNTCIEIGPIMLGGNVFGWTVDKEKGFEILDAFLEAGFNAIDTANTYSRFVPGNVGGESESIIGAWLEARGNRADVVIASKVGHDTGERGKGLSRAHIMQEVEGSLARLKTDYLDLYQAHYDDPATPFEETLSAFDELIKAGKVRAIGGSNLTAGRLAEALDVAAEKKLPPYRTLQAHYNLYDRTDFETTLQPLCREKGIGVIPYFSLARGFLTGKYRSRADFGKSPRGGRMDQYLNERGEKILAALDLVANAYGATPAAVSLSWLMHQDNVVAPIASATSIAHIRDFSTACRFEIGDYAAQIIEEASRY